MGCACIEQEFNRNNQPYEILRTLVCGIWNFSRSLWCGRIFIKSYGGEDGLDFRRHIRRFVRGLGIADVGRNAMGLDGGAGVHRIFGRRVHLAGGGGLDGLFDRRAEIIRGFVDFVDAGGLADFDRGAFKKPRLISGILPVHIRESAMLLPWMNFKSKGDKPWHGIGALRLHPANGFNLCKSEHADRASPPHWRYRATGCKLSPPPL